MFSHGQHYLQTEIDTKKAILDEMIDRFPSVLKSEIAHYKALMTKEAKAIAEGDVDVEISLKNSSQYNDVVDIQSTILVYHYYGLAMMVYTFAESSLKQICEKYNPKGKKVYGNYLITYYNQIRKQYNNLPRIKAVWKDRQSFQDIRNNIAHEMEAQNHFAIQEYLHKQLDDAYNMLCLVLNNVIIKKM